MVSRLVSVWLLSLREVAAAAGKWPKPPDVRPKGCVKPTSDFSNLTISIVLPWHQEKWEHLEGTVRSIIHYTPDELLEEIIFVSDGNADNKEKELKEITPKTRVITTKKREGLIRAKSLGVEAAKAPVLVFLEAHCIVNREWLEPLLARLLVQPKSLAMPMIDHIPQTDWSKYYPMTPGHWRYEWNLNLIFTNPGGVYKPDQHKPYFSPGTSGGIFAMRKDWFQQLGLFDTHMLQWGGDHIELTMKVWRCGGRIEMVPCSRVGHLYRDPEHRPYPVDVDQVVNNYARIAQIWMKPEAVDYLDLFYKMKPEAVHMKTPDMQEQKAIFDKLKCKSMSWYLENIDHEMAWESTRICHPYADHGDPVKCKGGDQMLESGRWTIERADVMPKHEFIKAKKESQQKRLATKTKANQAKESGEL